VILFYKQAEKITSNAPFLSRNHPFLLLSPLLIINDSFILICSLINNWDEATVFIGFIEYAYWTG
jgi:hypothetical protein